MRFTLAVVASLCAAGCMAHTQVDLAAIKEYDRVRVTLTDGERYEVLEPTVHADSLRGQLGQDGRPVGSFTAPLDRVESVEATAPSPRHTRLLVFGIVVGTAVILYVWVHSIFNDPNY